MNRDLVVVTGFSATADQSEYEGLEFPFNAILQMYDSVLFPTYLEEKYSFKDFVCEHIGKPKYVLREKYLSWRNNHIGLITKFPHRYKDVGYGYVSGYLLIDCYLRVIHVTENEEPEFNDITDQFEVIIVNADE